ncbi:MAG: hypothetical protein WC284_06475 [Candidimonas sp.]
MGAVTLFVVALGITSIVNNPNMQWGVASAGIERSEINPEPRR